MIRIGSAVVFARMTGKAVGRCAHVDSRDMAIVAGNRSMSSGQRECGCVVIECRRDPCCRIVACGAVIRKTGRCVIRVGCAVIVLDVTSDASCRSPGKYSSYVTFNTVQLGMRALKRKSGEMCMIESAGPAVVAMACLALS
jgi:hypothetical protein